MKIYWRDKDVPELAGLSWRERRKVMTAAYRKFGLRNRRCWVAMLVAGVIVGLASVIGDTLRYKFGQPDAIFYVCVVPALITGSMIYRQVVIQQLRPHYRDFVAEEKQRV